MHAIGAGLVSGTSRLLFGMSLDIVSFKLIFGTLMSIELFVALVSYQAANYPWLYCTCIILNFACIGGMFAVFPIAVVNVFGLEHGPTILTLVYTGCLLASIINVFYTMYLLKHVGFENLFYIGAFSQVLCLTVLWMFEEKLDVENLKRFGGVKVVREKTIRSDEIELPN